MVALTIAFLLFCVFGVMGHVRSPLERDNRKYNTTTYITWLVGVVFLMVGVGVYPYCNVWQSSLAGQAALQEAEFSRQIKVREAQATLDSAKMLASAEVERANGVAQANLIVADGLGGPEGYLRYLYIQGLNEGSLKGNTVIYVATEAGLPVTEAARLTPHVEKAKDESKN
jgi:hypothetical protein